MAISRNRINHSTQRVTIYFENTSDTLNVWFAPNLITPEWQRMVKKADKELERRVKAREDERQGYTDRHEDIPEHLVDDEAIDREIAQHQAGLLLTVVKDWDMLERDPSESEPDPPALPITFDTLDGLGYPIQARIIREIVESVNPDPTKPSNTGNGRGPAAVTVLSRNGR